MLDQRLLSLLLLLLACAGDQVSPGASFHSLHQPLEPINQALAPSALAVHSTQFTLLLLLLLLLPGLAMWRAAVASHSQRRDTIINTTLQLHHKQYCYCYCYMVQDLPEHPVGIQRGSWGTHTCSNLHKP